VETSLEPDRCVIFLGNWICSLQQIWAFVSLRFFILHCLQPVIIGGAIYLLFRTDTLVMFGWIQQMGLEAPLEDLRNWSAPAKSWIPTWVRYSLPDGLWVFSCTAFFVRLWWNDPRKIRLFWMGIGPAMGIGGELGQIPGWVPGRFDIVDLLCCLLAALAALHVGSSHAATSAPDSALKNPA
jgi:hypothetical protein